MATALSGTVQLSHPHYPWLVSICLVVATHCVLDPSDGVFGRFDLAALGGCHTLNVCYVMLTLLTPVLCHSV